jgi:DNA repair exonuclease SbcCD ATPase subunit
LKLEIQSVKLKNFLSFGSSLQEVDFLPGVNLVLGRDLTTGRSNGSGKSSFLESIPYALFGQTHKDIKKAQLVNWRSRKACEVVLRFKKGDNIYDVLRAIKPDKFEIYENESLIDFTGVKDYQKTLEDIIGLNYQTFCSLIHSNINSSNRILSMKRAEKRKFIENVFGLELYSFIDLKARDKHKNLLRKVTKLGDDVNRNNKTIIEAKARILTLNNKLRRIRTSDIELREAKVKYEELVKEYPSISGELKGLDEELKEVSDSINNNRILATKTDGKIRLINSWIRTEHKKLTDLTGSKICPTCGQTIKKSVDYTEAEIKAKKGRYSKAIDMLEILDAKVDSHIKLSENKWRLLTEERNDKKAIELLIEDKRIKVRDLTKQLEIEESARDEFKVMIETETKAIKALESENEGLDKKARTLITVTDYLTVIREICKDDNIKQFAISSIMPYLNRQTNHYLSDVGYGFYALIDRWLEADIRGPGVTNASYGSLSGGEARGIDLAMQFALLDIARVQAGIWPDIIVMDEILDSSVDNQGISKLMSIIKGKQVEDQSKLFIISHRDEIDDFDADNTYYVSKDGYSKVVLNG